MSFIYLLRLLLDPVGLAHRENRFKLEYLALKLDPFRRL